MTGKKGDMGGMKKAGDGEREVIWPCRLPVALLVDGREQRDDTWILLLSVVSEGGQKDGIYYERYHAASMACLQRFYLTTLLTCYFVLVLCCVCWCWCKYRQR